VNYRILLLPLAALALSAQVEPPRRSGAVVIATSPQLAPVLRDLAVRFEHEAGGSPITVVAAGSDVAMARLTSGSADAAIIGRAAFDPEAKAYEWVYRQPPASRAVFSGSFAAPGKSPALAFRVNAANPLKAITLDQIKRAFAQSDAGLTWRALGVGGALADRRVMLVMPDAEGGTGRYLRAAALSGQVQFPWNRVREIAPAGFGDDQYTARITAAVVRDPAAIGAGDGAAAAGTRVLAVIVDGKACYPVDPCYPFTRTVMAYSDPAPRAPVAAFFQFLDSPAARALIAKDGYRPLETGGPR